MRGGWLEEDSSCKKLKEDSNAVKWLVMRRSNFQRTDRNSDTASACICASVGNEI